MSFGGFGLSLILGGDDSITFRYAVVDLDGGAIAQVFVERVLDPLEDGGLVKLTLADSLEEGRDLAEHGSVSATFILPLGFSSAVQSGQGTQIDVIGNVEAPIGTMVASSIAEAFASEVTAVQASVATVFASGGGNPGDVAALAERAAAMPNPISVTDVPATEKKLDPKTFYAAGMAVFSLFFTVQFGISSLLDERREGTLSRLLAAPIPRWSILAGKFTTSFVLGVVSMAVLVVATSLLLGAEWGDPVGVALLIVVGIPGRHGPNGTHCNLRDHCGAGREHGGDRRDGTGHGRRVLLPGRGGGGTYRETQSTHATRLVPAGPGRPAWWRGSRGHPASDRGHPRLRCRHRRDRFVTTQKAGANVKVFAIAGTNLRRLFRQPATIFFVIIFPWLLILLLGATFGGGSTPVIGVVAREIGPLGEDLVDLLEELEDAEIKRYSSEDDLLDAVERGRVQAGLVIPKGYDAALRAGDDIVLRLFIRPGSFEQRATVEAAVGEQSALIRSARFAQSEGVASLDDALRAAQAVAGVSRVQVRTTRVGEASSSADLGKFDQGASTQLLLFIFMTSLPGAVALIETRRLGVARRMFSTPTAARTILAGEALGSFGLALVQGLIIVFGSALVFGVSWGNPAGAALILIMFSLVGAGVGMLLGSVFSNDQQAQPVALLIGLGLAALGGSMVPLEVFPDTMRTIAHVTPHAWGNDAFNDLVGQGGDVADILRELGVLAAVAVVLLTLATWRLRKAITS